MIQILPPESPFPVSEAKPSPGEVPAVVQRFADALAADSDPQSPAGPSEGVQRIVPFSADPLDAPLTADERHAAAGFFSLALAVTGVFTLALPLGMLAAYLGGRALAGLLRSMRNHPLAITVAALGAIGGAVDAGIALWRLSGGLIDVLRQASAG
jgi:hypothetical protein